MQISEHMSAVSSWPPRIDEFLAQSKLILHPIERVSHLPRNLKRLLCLITDGLLIAVAFYGAFSLIVGNLLPFSRLELYCTLLPIILVCKLGCFYLLGMYRSVLRYAGLEFLYTALKAVLAAEFLLILSIYTLQFPPTSMAVWVLDGSATFMLTVGIRLTARWCLYDRRLRRQAELGPHHPTWQPLTETVIIYGAGSCGVQVSQALAQHSRYQVAAFVDDDRQLQGSVVNGLRVYAPGKLPDLVAQFHIRTLLLAMPSVPRHQRRTIIESLPSLPLRVKTVPDIEEIVSGKVCVSEVRHVEITDLLGRDEVLPDATLLQANIRNQVVMVTGAGGSIGTELCRQIAKQHPRHLLLFELNEYALYRIDLELTESFPQLHHTACLGSVTDGTLLREIMTRYGVQTIYHAAAYKHVPMVEMNPTQGIVNNVYGTLKAAQVAQACGVNTFVLVSSDKAVRPTNVMGTTKRIAELILQALAHQEEGDTRFIIVRFGNVMDSTGSVIPRFRQQIAQGKPLTVTHPDVTRYFMSIPEASRLVIQAGALGTGGDVFLLDMGEPIKIYDLALQMIRLSGLIPDRDIPITITGLRPGEKLYEELLIDQTKAKPTRHPKIYSAREHSLPWEVLEPKLNALLEAVKHFDLRTAKLALKSLVPEYQPSLEPPIVASNTISDCSGLGEHTPLKMVHK